MNDAFKTLMVEQLEKYWFSDKRIHLNAIFFIIRGGRGTWAWYLRFWETEKFFILLCFGLLL